MSQTTSQKTNDVDASAASACSKVLQRYTPRQRYWVVMAAVWAGDLSEGQAATLLDEPAVALRESVREFMSVADALWKRYRATGETVVSDIAVEVRRDLSCTKRHDD